MLPLFGAVAQLRELQPSVFHALRLDFYGTVNADFAEQLDRLALHEVVRYHGTVTRDDAVRAQCGSDALLLFMPDTREQEDAVYTKTYEYMAARKPLIAVAPEAGENARVLAAAGMGRVFSAHETEEMAAYLMELAATKKRLGRLPPQGDPTVIANYSYRALAGRLARVFDAALDSGPAA